MIVDDGVLKGMSGFFEMFERQASRLDDSLQDVAAQQQRVQAEMEALRTNLAQLGAARTHTEAR